MTVEKSSAILQDLLHLRAIVEQTLGADNINMIYALRPIADLDVSLGLHEEAEAVQRLILAMATKRPTSPYLPSVDQAGLALAYTLQQLDKHEEAIQLFQAVLATNRDDYSEPFLGITLAMEESLLAAGRFAEAVVIIESVLAGLGDAPNSGQLCWLDRLSGCFSRQGDYAKAAAVMERTIPLLEAKAEVCCIPQLDNLAALYSQAGDSAAHDRVRARRRFLANKHNF